MRKHPLAFVIIIALLIRIPAVIWSQGFIHSDDHFDSVEVAYDWLRNGIEGDNGYLHWKNWNSDEIGRFPLYALSLYGIMKAYQTMGVTSLNAMMYGIRLAHALLSLFPVLAAFGIMRIISKKTSWAVFAGLVVALNFAMPFLGVRNLIEVVGGNLWAGALYCFYRYRDARAPIWLYWAGIFTGLAWMIRFQIAFAVLPIPFILWFEARSIRPALHYILAVGAMLIASGLADWLVLGSFASSTIRNLTMNTSLGALYYTIPLLYPVEIIAFLVPPFSFFALYVMGKRSFWRNHLLIAASSLSFIAFHMIHANQQERFIMPIIPALLIMTAQAVWEKYRHDGYIFRTPAVRYWIVIPTLIINGALLVTLTFSTGHRGQVYPLVWTEKMDPHPSLLIFQPEISQWMPMDYAGFKPGDIAQIRSWADLQIHREPKWQQKHWEYILLYPRSDEDIPAYLDSARAVFGDLEPVREFAPSCYDDILHMLNRRHNPSFACFVYRPVQN